MLDRPSTMQDVAEFVTDYISNDVSISNHSRFAATRYSTLSHSESG